MSQSSLEQAKENASDLGYIMDMTLTFDLEAYVTNEVCGPINSGGT